MSLAYTGISWNRQKRLYDATLGGLVALAVGGFVGVSAWRDPQLTAETLIIRGSAVGALLLLHLVLCIGPLARLDHRFLPLLYNRRHLGVTMFLIALIHGIFSIVQFHALGNENPLVSVFTAYHRDYGTLFSRELAHFPFEPFGVAALLILLLMAATSHDFWLKSLGAGVWKALHLGVYLAYGSVLVHVALGALQAERSPVFPALLGLGFAIVAGLHLAAYRQEARVDRARRAATEDGFVEACGTEEIMEGRAKIISTTRKRIAVWRHAGKFYATANVCRHQGGPLGEGRILDGCITCPWHGWQYRPEDGCSPPPFQEIVATHDVRMVHGRIFVQEKPNPLRQMPEVHA